MSKRVLFFILLILGLLGLGVSIYLVQHHYQADTGFCDINAIISCSTVNRSSYSELYGIPVAYGGILWSLGLIALAFYNRKHRFPALLNLVWNSLALVGVLYFIYAEVQLQALCLWCSVVHLVVVFSFMFSLYLYKKRLLRE